MPVVTSKPKTFSTVVVAGGAGKAHLPIPFDPSKQWGKRDRWHVNGTLNDLKVRGVVEPGSGGHIFKLGPAWLRDNPVKVGDKIKAVLAIEGPQREDLAPDFAKALAKSPAASKFWDTIAQFYRKGYLHWIDSTKKSPEERVRRIAEVVRLLAAGRKSF